MIRHNQFSSLVQEVCRYFGVVLSIKKILVTFYAVRTGLVIIWACGVASLNLDTKVKTGFQNHPFNLHLEIVELMEAFNFFF